MEKAAMQKRKRWFEMEKAVVQNGKQPLKRTL